MTLQARITPQGSLPIVYDMDSGAEQDKFFGPGFTQRRVIGAPIGAGLPDYSVIFEPDEDGSRDQVQFNIGRCDSRVDQNTAAKELGAHLVEIIKDGKILATVNAQAHYANCRWRWMSSRRPFIKSGSQLMADGLIPPYGGTPVPPGKMDFSKAVYSGPMGNAGYVEFMGMTGDRPDIGFIPGFYIPCVLDPTDAVAANAFYAFAETGGSIPWIFRDAATGAPMNLVDHPKANIYPDGARLQGTPNVSAQSSSPFNLDNAHFPSVSWLPGLMTGDPYYVEGTQFECIGAMMITSYYSSPTEEVFDPSQIRGWAWIDRINTQARVLTELVESWGKRPSWLLPSSHFATISKDNAVVADELWTNNPYPSGTVFGAMTRIVATEPWEEDFASVSVGYNVKRGYTEWQNLWEKVCLKNLAWRTQKDTGMPRSWVLYAGNFGKDGAGMPDTTNWHELEAKGFTNANFVQSPTEFWMQFLAEGAEGNAARVANLAQNPDNDGHEARQGGPDFLFQCRGALCIAVWNGRTDFVEPLQFYDLMVKNGGALTMQWAFSSNPDNLPPTTPPVQPPPPSSPPVSPLPQESPTSVPPTSEPTPPSNQTPPPAPVPPQGVSRMQLAHGSSRTVSFANFKDVDGKPEPLPAGMVSSIVASPDGLVTLGTPAADGLSVPFTVGNTDGTVTFSATLKYPDGDAITVNSVSADIVSPENVSADLVIV